METKKDVFAIIALSIVGYIIRYVLFVACMLFLFSHNTYRDEHKDLYTVAVNNIFGVTGYLSNG